MTECPKGHWKAVLGSDRGTQWLSRRDVSVSELLKGYITQSRAFARCQTGFYLFNQKENIGQLIHNFLHVLFLFSF
ncbi:hypothetical protein HDEF_1093 [Candidatus Hamiltonella defensa 5AT (Acyrthosiphon pisum)]|uniref:Uncharacterized protein n=1 Tax=Hamiltonella defensa subsp. Acyrthosiphon pisum (strain 5AT) TaxID=572265 RepID=C4K5C5_HAMD5|nr:hypothetical protein HDEF_1093 [Candidatus Hamiltonella defensa 5AT (Acyrthosiphon pisum)]